MKKIIYPFMLLAASFSVVACDEDKVENNPDTELVTIEDDCPEGKSTTGEPCK